jgi:hypothetical protein
MLKFIPTLIVLACPLSMLAMTARAAWGRVFGRRAKTTATAASGVE